MVVDGSVVTERLQGGHIETSKLARSYMPLIKHVV